MSLFPHRKLSKIIDECIKELKDERGRKTATLSTLLHSWGRTTGEDIYLALAPAIGVFGSEVENFSVALSTTPMVPTEKKSEYQKTFNESVEKGTKALNILKRELCEKNKVNHEQIIKAIALLNDAGYTLHEERSYLSRPRTSR